MIRAGRRPCRRRSASSASSAVPSAGARRSVSNALSASADSSSVKPGTSSSEPCVPSQRRPLEQIVALGRHQLNERERVTEVEPTLFLRSANREDEGLVLDRAAEAGQWRALGGHERMFAPFSVARAGSKTGLTKEDSALHAAEPARRVGPGDGGLVVVGDETPPAVVLREEVVAISRQGKTLAFGHKETWDGCSRNCSTHSAGALLPRAWRGQAWAQAPLRLDSQRLGWQLLRAGSPLPDARPRSWRTASSQVSRRPPRKAGPR